jgi:hypothetical protein
LSEPEQPAVAVQVTHLPPFTEESQILPVRQPPAASQTTQVPVDLSQTGVPVPHWLLSVQPTHFCVAVSQCRFAAQPSVAVQVTHLPEVASQTGVLAVPAHSLLAWQGRQPVVPQTGVAPLQPSAAVHATHEPLLVLQTLPAAPAQSPSAWQPRHALVPVSQTGVEPLQPSAAVQTTQAPVLVLQTGVAGVAWHCVSLVHADEPLHLPPGTVVSQVWPLGQATVALQSTQLPTAPLRSQVGVAGGHTVLEAQPVHAPPLQVRPPQPSEAVHTTQLPDTTSQTGVAGVAWHWVSLVQAPAPRHLPPVTVVSQVWPVGQPPRAAVQTTQIGGDWAVSQTGVAVAHWAFIVHPEHWPPVQTVPVVQPVLSEVQATQVGGVWVLSQIDLAPLQAGLQSEALHWPPA